MFNDNGKSTRQATLRTIMNTTMIEVTPIKDHIVSMIKLFNEIEIIGVVINKETKVDMTLETLLYSFGHISSSIIIWKGYWWTCQS